MDHIFFIHSSVGGHLGCFFLLKESKFITWTASGMASQTSSILSRPGVTPVRSSYSALCHLWTRSSLVITPQSFRWFWGLTFNWWSVPGAQGLFTLVLDPFPYILPQEIKHLFSKRNLMKRFLPLETYLGLLNQEMKTTRESDPVAIQNSAFLDLVNALVLGD